MLIHAENGSWLYLSDTQQLLGPYGDGNGPDLGSMTIPNSIPPTQQFNLVKQMSVPHGNSILASGTFQPQNGAPIIAAPPQVLPVGINTDAYTTQSVGNLNPAFALNPNLPLSDAVTLNAPTQFIQFDVDSLNGGFEVTNIGYEQQHAKVTRYFATYWLEAFGGIERLHPAAIFADHHDADPDRQPRDRRARVTLVSFPHITTNTLTKVS